MPQEISAKLSTVRKEQIFICGAHASTASLPPFAPLLGINLDAARYRKKRAKDSAESSSAAAEGRKYLLYGKRFMTFASPNDMSDMDRRDRTLYMYENLALFYLHQCSVVRSIAAFAQHRFLLRLRPNPQSRSHIRAINCDIQKMSSFIY
jgi:hypothetical protein